MCRIDANMLHIYARILKILENFDLKYVNKQPVTFDMYFYQWNKFTPQNSINWESPVSKVLLYLTFCFVFRSIESLSADEMIVSRQAYAGLLWSKQFYYYLIDEWLKGDPSMPRPPPNAWREKTQNGSTCTIKMWFPCLTNGSIHGYVSQNLWFWRGFVICLHIVHKPKKPMHSTRWTGNCVNPRFAFKLS